MPLCCPASDASNAAAKNRKATQSIPGDTPKPASPQSSSGEKPEVPLPDGIEKATWAKILTMLRGIEKKPMTEQLLNDVPTLRQWQQAAKPTQKVRDAMMKLGSTYQVSRYIARKKRPPLEVARDLDERMRKKAREVLGSVAKSATHMQLALDKASTSEPNPASTSNVAKLAMDDMTSTANTTTDQEPQPTVLSLFASQKRSAEEIPPVETGQASKTSRSSKQLSFGDVTVTFENILSLLQHLDPDSLDPDSAVKRLRSHHKVLSNWHFIKTTDDLKKLQGTCGSLNVLQSFRSKGNRTRRKTEDLANDVENRLLEETARLLGYIEDEEILSPKVKKSKSPKVQVDFSDKENSEVEVVVNDLNAIARWIDALFDQNPEGWWVHATTIDDVVNSIECD